MEQEHLGVLVAIDGSAISILALHRGLDLAQEKRLPVMILAIVPPRLWRARQGQFQASPEKHDEDFVRGILAQAHDIAKGRGVHVNERVRSGSPARIIPEEAARGFDFIVMGERPNLVGAPSLASLVRRHSLVPVEVVDDPT